MDGFYFPPDDAKCDFMFGSTCFHLNDFAEVITGYRKVNDHLLSEIEYEQLVNIVQTLDPVGSGRLIQLLNQEYWEVPVISVEPYAEEQMDPYLYPVISKLAGSYIGPKYLSQINSMISNIIDQIGRAHV